MKYYNIIITFKNKWLCVVVEECFLGTVKIHTQQWTVCVCVCVCVTCRVSSCALVLGSLIWRGLGSLHCMSSPKQRQTDPESQLIGIIFFHLISGDITNKTCSRNSEPLTQCFPWTFINLCTLRHTGRSLKTGLNLFVIIKITSGKFPFFSINNDLLESKHSRMF